MRTLQEQNEDNDFTVLAFPCNQFGAQEPGSNSEILEFATSNYNANFPLFAKIEVNGDGACALYQMLKSAQPDDEGKQDIAWNFTKFLVDGEGNVVRRFNPQVTPEEIGEALGQS